MSGPFRMVLETRFGDFPLNQAWEDDQLTAPLPESALWRTYTPPVIVADVRSSEFANLNVRGDYSVVYIDLPVLMPRPWVSVDQDECLPGAVNFASEQDDFRPPPLPPWSAGAPDWAVFGGTDEELFFLTPPPPPPPAPAPAAPADTSLTSTDGVRGGYLIPPQWGSGIAAGWGPSTAPDLPPVRWNPPKRDEEEEEEEKPKRKPRPWRRPKPTRVARRAGKIKKLRAEDEELLAVLL